MPINTVGDLREFLREKKLSPESLAKATAISNMTLRRLLEKTDSTALPKRYHLQLNSYGNKIQQDSLNIKSPADFSTFMGEINQLGTQVTDAEELFQKVENKLTHESSIGETLKDSVLRLIRELKEGRWTSNKALSLGALAYFFNPADLIPDVLPGVGYLDDFAVLSLVMSYLASHFKIPSK